MQKRLHQVLLVFSIIFICHFSVFLAFYPGICTYDLNAQIAQYVDHDFCTSHPLLHTLFIGFFHDLFANEQHNNNINLGYAIATILQLLIVDSAMTYSVMYIRTICTKKWVSICAIIFYAIFPVNSLLAISHTKDTLFAAFALIFLIDSLRLLLEKTPHMNLLYYIRMVISATLMVLLRNNAVYALLSTFLILLIMFIRCLLTNINDHTKDLSIDTRSNYSILQTYLLILFTTLILSIIGNKALIIATDADPGSIKEMMSIPAQIMGRIYNTVANEEEKELILEYIPNADEYTFYISDPMKLNLPFEIWESKCKHFLLDSAIMAIHHPITAIEAVWYNIQGYIDPFHMPYSSDHFYLARYDYRGDAEIDSKLPRLCDIYVRLFRTTADYSNTPIVIFFNLGLYIWIDIIGIVVMNIGKKNRYDYKAYNIAFLSPIMYLLTLLLGPASIMRYGYLYVLLSPISIAFILKKSINT